MSLLGQEVARFVAESIVWLGIELALAGAIVLATAPFVLGELRRRTLWALAGGMIVAAVAVRFGLPQAWAPTIGTRPLPVAWSIVGAVGGGVVLWALSLRRAGSHQEG